MQILQLITSPDNINDWNGSEIIDRQKRILKWHDFIRELSGTTVSHVWGSHQILNHREPSSSKEAYVTVLDVENLDHYDDIMAKDPLRDRAKYMTVMLTRLEDDWSDDQKRLEEAKRDLFDTKDAEPDWYMQERRMFKKRPDYVGKHKFIKPENPPVNWKTGREKLNKQFAGKPLEILIYGMNPEEMMLWSDVRKLIHYEKVIWWHHHIAEMLNRGHVSHVWGTHDFCRTDRTSGNSANAPVVYRATDLDEFDSIYRKDPLRTHGRFISLVLRPIEDQARYDELRLDQVKRLY